PSAAALSASAAVTLVRSLRSLTGTTLRPRPPSEECPSTEGPHAQDGPANHRSSPDGTKDAAVRGIRPIVAHHPQAALGDRDGAEVRRAGSGGEVGLDQFAPVDEHVSVLALHRLAGKPDHTLDVLLGRRLQDADRLEH